MEELTASAAASPDPASGGAAVPPTRQHDHPAVFALIFFAFWRLYETIGCYRGTVYNAHVYLAWAMLHGRFDLINPPGHFELAHAAGRSYIAYGIGPSLLMLPLVALWGPAFNQSMFNAALGGLTAALWWSVTGLFGFDRWGRLWLTALFALGSMFCFAAGQSGNTW